MTDRALIIFLFFFKYKYDTDANVSDISCSIENGWKKCQQLSDLDSKT